MYKNLRFSTLELLLLLIEKHKLMFDLSYINLTSDGLSERKLGNLCTCSKQ